MILDLWQANVNAQKIRHLSPTISNLGAWSLDRFKREIAAHPLEQWPGLPTSSHTALLGITAAVVRAPVVAGNLTADGRGAAVEHAIYGTQRSENFSAGPLKLNKLAKNRF